MTEREALIGISANVSFGPARIKLFLEYFGSARKVWNAPREKFQELGLSQKLLLGWDEFRKKFNIDEYLSKLEKYKVSFVTINDKDYPKRLATINDAPYILYIKGNILPEDNVCIAIVGSRKITSYGRDVAMQLSQDLSGSGVTIVSGLALGVDGFAHKGAIFSDGRTIAVLGHGLDTIYPPNHHGLAQEVVSHGALISEFPIGYPALPPNFPYRNRIISGMSLGVVVVEGTEKSGTLLTAAHAAAQGREVFAVPGQITSPNSQASHILIKQGAKLVTSAQDILEELEIGDRIQKRVNSQILPENEDEKIVIDILGVEPLHVDEIVRKLNKDAGKTLSVLTQMELTGKIKHLGGMVYDVIR